MPYDIQITEHNGIYTRYYGEVSDQELYVAAEQKLANPRIISIDYLLSDYSNVTEFNVTATGIRSLAELTEPFATKKPDLIIVSIMPKDIQYGYARMFQAYVADEKTGWQTYVAKTEQDAKAKLEEFLSLKFKQN